MKKYLFLLIFVSFNAIAQTGFTKSDWKNQLETEKFFNNLVDGTRFKIHLKELTKKAIKTKKIVTVEIENINQLKQILELKFKRVLFDNMNLKLLRKCIKLCKNKYETEYSGNTNLKNVIKISSTGVNRISVGSITHSAKSFDSTLLI